MFDVQNFTIFIKNSISFPLFDVTRYGYGGLAYNTDFLWQCSDFFLFFFSLRGNFPSTMTSNQIKKCTYHPETNRFCPIFRVGDILNYTGQSVEKITEKVLPLTRFTTFVFEKCSAVLRASIVLFIQGGEIGINIEWNCNLDRSKTTLYSFL